jgi:hypothetical protein
VVDDTLQKQHGTRGDMRSCRHRTRHRDRVGDGRVLREIMVPVRAFARSGRANLDQPADVRGHYP